MVVVSKHANVALSRRLAAFLSVALQHGSRLFTRSTTASNKLEKRVSEYDLSPSTNLLLWLLILALVLTSGIFAGLTLGYMGLDETQLNVLSVSGTPNQRRYAQKVKPIRKHGHLLLVTLLLANVITNETLPIIADPVLGGGFKSIVFSTVILLIFSEILPQSICTRHGLYLGAKMAGFTQILIYVLGIIAWPIAKVLEWILGPHRGIVYRRPELKELITMHAVHGKCGGDLASDTVNVVGTALDLQGKVVKEVITPLDSVFMLPIESKMDYGLLKKISEAGHTRIPVYEEFDVPVSAVGPFGPIKRQRAKRMLGILLAKQCILLDPRDEIRLRDIPLHKALFIPSDEPLLGMLDKFQQDRSHMAFVTRYQMSVQPLRPRKIAKNGVVQRLRERFGLFEFEEKHGGEESFDYASISDDDDSTLRGDSSWETNVDDMEMGIFQVGDNSTAEDLHAVVSGVGTNAKSVTSSSTPLERVMSSDMLPREGNTENSDPAVMPLGILTLEDVLACLAKKEF